MEEVMRKISQITTASLKISILALLFIVTAAPHIRDYGGTKLHQENASKGGIVANETLLDAVAPTNGFNPNTNIDQTFGDGDGKHELSSNELGFSHHANIDKVAPKTNELGQAQRSALDGSGRAFKNSNNIVLDTQAPMVHDPKLNSSMHQGAMNSVQDRN